MTRNASIRAVTLAAVGRSAAVAVLVVLVATGMSRPVAGVVPSSGVLFGVSTPSPTGTATAASVFAGEESRFGRTLAVDRSFYRWDDVQPAPLLVADVAAGRVPLASVRSQRRDGSVIPWATVASGAVDAQIQAQAAGLASLGAPVILAFHHEPELSSGYGTPADFVAAFRHYVTVFRAAGATNVAFAVVLGASTYRNGGAVAWYPGDDAVDWIGVDAYNFAACVPGQPAWRSLADAAGPFYTWAAPRGKPLVLAEWGSAEDPSVPDRKAQWLADAATTLAGWPAVKAAAYFDRVGTCDWRLSTSASAEAEFRSIATSPWANGTATARVVPSTTVGPAPLPITFDGSSSTGAGAATGTGVTAWRLDFGDGTSAASGTGQPGTVAHTYAVGGFTAKLTVQDAAGGVASTSVTVTSAGPPTISEGTPSAVTASSATLPVWVVTSGIAGSVWAQWGATSSLGQTSSAAPLAATMSTQAVHLPVSGLPAGTRVYWRAVAQTAAGTTFGPLRWFTTAM